MHRCASGQYFAGDGHNAGGMKEAPVTRGEMRQNAWPQRPASCAPSPKLCAARSLRSFPRDIASTRIGSRCAACPSQNNPAPIATNTITARTIDCPRRQDDRADLIGAALVRPGGHRSLPLLVTSNEMTVPRPGSIEFDPDEKGAGKKNEPGGKEPDGCEGQTPHALIPGPRRAAPIAPPARTRSGPPPSSCTPVVGQRPPIRGRRKSKSPCLDAAGRSARPATDRGGGRNARGGKPCGRSRSPRTPVHRMWSRRLATSEYGR